MTVAELTCAGCAEPFTAKSPRAKWCSSTCRQRAARAAKSEPAQVEAEPADVEQHGLVDTTLRDLTTAGRVDTALGQLALQLARRLAQPDESGISSLSREYRTVLAAALEGTVPPADVAEPDAEPDDELEKARLARERKASDAARRA